MKKIILTAMALAMSASILQAQAVRNGAERASDHHQIRNDKQDIARDRQEIAQFKNLRQNLRNAVETGNVDKAHLNHRALIESMEREIRQGEQKTAEAQREVRGSSSELASDRREVRRDRNQGKPLQAVDDRHDKRDDRRDLRDDVSDRNERAARTQRQREILAVFKGITVKGNPNAFAALKAKQNLLDEFEQTMIRDMGENYEELREDHGELREDRRETREDRRQR